MSKPIHKELDLQVKELTAQVERLRNAAYGMLVNRTGMDEWYDLEKAYHETPPTALVKLKAQWQAEAFSAFVSTLENVKNEAECSEDTLVKEMVEFSIKVTERYLASITQHA